MLGYEPVLEKKIRGKPVLGDAITCLIPVDYIAPYYIDALLLGGKNLDTRE